MRNKYTAITGLDVQQNSIALVSLVHECASVRLVGAAYQALPPGVVEQGEWRDREVMQDVLRRGYAALGERGRAVVLSISNEAVITMELALLSFPFAHQSCAEIRDLVTRLSPWPLADTAAAWSSRAEGRALLAICRADVIQASRRCLRTIGLQLQHVEPECQSHWRLLCQLWRGPVINRSTVVLVIVQTDLLCISIFHHGGLRLSHSVVPNDMASTQPTANYVVEELQKTFDQIGTNGVTTRLIAVMGGLAEASLCDVLQNTFAAPVTLLSPLTGLLEMTKASSLSLADIEPRLGVALGSALWGYNG